LAEWILAEWIFSRITVFLQLDSGRMDLGKKYLGRMYSGRAYFGRMDADRMYLGLSTDIEAPPQRVQQKSKWQLMSDLKKRFFLSILALSV
jgi:hypothetical protein